MGGVQAHSEQVDSSHDVILGEVGEQNILPGNPWAVTLQLRTKDMKFNIDIGAEVTVISEAVRRDISQPSLLSSDQALTLKSFQQREFEDKHARSRGGDLYCERPEPLLG